MILICYDGSDDAKAAIEHGAQVLSGQKAVVLTAWEPFALIATHTPVAIGFLPTVPDVDEIDRANESYANTQAETGAEIARKAGFDAEPLTRRVARTTAAAILAEAETQDADAILLGSRGLTGLKSLLLGSVSHAVIQHADRPVIVVPSPTVALSRTEMRRHVSDNSELKDRG